MKEIEWLIHLNQLLNAFHPSSLIPPPFVTILR
jgi:hypothetical protein